MKPTTCFGLLFLLLNLTSVPLQAEDARILITQFQCGRCHELPDAARTESPEAAARWKARVASFARTPSLASISGRLRREWVAQFLVQPFHVRTRLPGSEPRKRITSAQAEAIAAYLFGEQRAEAQAISGETQKGLHAMNLRGCFGCHIYSGVVTPLHPPGTTAFSPYQSYAPDLRYTRQRMTPQMVQEWLKNPAHVAPNAVMPRVGVDPSEIGDVVAALFRAELKPIREFSVAPLEPLSRKVSFAEVKSKVLDAVCMHCHMNPAVVGAEAGAGSTGGFGYAGVDLDLSSEEGVKCGLRRTGAQARESILKPLPSGNPLLVEVLIARHREEHGNIDPQILGMPLGLAPISFEDIRLLLTWARKEEQSEPMACR